MKRLFYVFAVCLMASCTKESQYTTARIDYGFGNSLTKVSARDIVSETLADITDVDVFFYADGARVAQGKAGQAVTLPVGDVNVRLVHCGGERVYFDSTAASDLPSFVADTTIAFHSYTNAVIVRADYTCAMILMDADAVESAYLVNPDGKDLITARTFGDKKVFYLTLGCNCEIELKVKALTDYEDRTVALKVGDIENGRYYTLDPTGISNGTAGFLFGLGDFEEGSAL